MGERNRESKKATPTYTTLHSRSPPTSARSTPSRPSTGVDAVELKQKKHKISLKEMIRVLSSMKRFHNGFVLGSHTHTRQCIVCLVEERCEGEVDGCVG